MPENLRPCPFCGGTDIHVIESTRPFIGCWNEDCMANGPSAHTVEAAIAAWNQCAAQATGDQDFSGTVAVCQGSMIRHCADCLRFARLAGYCGASPAEWAQKYAQAHNIVCAGFIPNPPPIPDPLTVPGFARSDCRWMDDCMGGFITPCAADCPSYEPATPVGTVREE